MTIESESAEIVKTILLLAKTLKLETVAEGIEHFEQLQFLKKFGCDYAQGFYLSKPLSAPDALAFINKSFGDYDAAFGETIEPEHLVFEH